MVNRGVANAAAKSSGASFEIFGVFGRRRALAPAIEDVVARFAPQRRGHPHLEVCTADAMSVASVVYRLFWARMRTFQLLKICHLKALPMVGPRLSTRSLWGFVSDYVAEEEAIGGSPSGVALDITKAFNVMRRPLVSDVMKHFGLPANIVSAWMSALDGMERQILVAGCVYQALDHLRQSTAGVEGDPLSVVAMFCMCLFFCQGCDQE